MALQQTAEFYREREARPFIETASGRQFFIDAPEFDTQDIARALSKQCRYTGHCSKFYSVAEHSVIVAAIMKMLDLGDPFEGLMHDGSEAFLSDIAAPWKALLPDYKILEAKIERPMRLAYGLPEFITDGCKKADWLALFVEARVLMPSKARDWISPPGLKELAATITVPIEGFPPSEAETLFLEAFNQLNPRPQAHVVA
jgi:hypothetical protein